MRQKRQRPPATTYVSIAIGVFMIAIIAINRSFPDFTFFTLMGYVAASFTALVLFWGIVWIATVPLGGVTRFGEDNPSRIWTAITLIAGAVTGAGGFFTALILLGL